MLAKGQELAMYISRNEEIKHFPEDEQEGLLMYIRQYKAKALSDADYNKLGDWLHKLASDMKKSTIGQIMNHRETTDDLITLEDFEPHFNYHVVYSTSWVKKNLHSISGGVSGFFIIYKVVTKFILRLS